MSNGPKIVKPVKEMSRIEELVLQLTNKHAQQRAVGEWQARIEMDKMDGTTVQDARCSRWRPSRASCTASTRA